MDRSDLALAAKGWLTSAWTPFDVKMAMSDPMEHIQYLEAATVAPGAGADFVASKHAGLVKIEPRTARAEQWLDRAATGEASWDGNARSEEHTSELQSLMRTSYDGFCLKTKKQ